VGFSVKLSFLKGVIEGFYGRPWSYETRLAYADFLPHLGLDTYIYCPKGDPFLRRRWHQPWPSPDLQQLKNLSKTYRERSLNFGIGLSPFALYQSYGKRQRELLQAKVAELNTLEAPVLAILFDDMPGALDALASRQSEIVTDIVQWSSASRVLVCPTYYSFDPVLERHFGTMPEDYWQQLGRALPEQVEILWTGNLVCSESVSVADIENIRLQLERPVMLWDNYPVNDGATRSNFLYGHQLDNRDPGLAEVLSGHLCNPMNQGLVSLLALRGLGELYGSTTKQWPAGAFDAQTYRQLMQNIDDFQQLGLSGMGASRCRQLADLYGGWPGAAAQEVAGWLRGEYTFDPACLTD